jgi:hypothetical protein
VTRRHRVHPDVSSPKSFGQSDRPQAANSYSIDIFAEDLAALAAPFGDRAA